MTAKMTTSTNNNKNEESDSFKASIEVQIDSAALAQ